jgi:hypothetical protein
MSLAEVQPKGMVFVVIPIVIVPVITVVVPVAVIVVTPVFFLASIVLRPGRSTHCRWDGEGGCKNKRAEKISITSVHVVFLLAQEFPLGNLGTQRVCIVHLAEDVRYRTSARTTEVHSRPGQNPAFEYGKGD